MRHLFVVAHPDDEALGAGAFMAEAAARGDKVAVLTLNSVDLTRYKETESQLYDDMICSHQMLGVSESHTRAYVDGDFGNCDHRSMVEDIEQTIREFQPDRVYTHHPSDINHDHLVVFQSCMEAFRLWQRGREKVHPVTGFYLMEVLSSTDWGINPAVRDFHPNTYVPVKVESLARKVEALSCYENVMRDIPHPRTQQSIYALARLRGGQSGVPYAEAFECIFRLEV